jgi:Protein of unknown function (DUF1320)
MYTPIIAPADLNSVLYPEIQNEITRNDGGALATEAIDTAIQEAKMYLTRYDLVKLFGDQATNVSATFSDSYLSRMIKDIATWHLLQLANPNYSYEGAKGRYAEAVESLKRIQKGTADPQWPDADTTGETSQLPDNIASFQFPKRNNGY